MNVELLDKAVAEALCPTFQAIVPVTNTIAVAGLASAVVNPLGIKIAMTAAAVSQLSMLGASATCPEVDIGPEPPNLRDGCWEVDTAAVCWIRNRDFPDTKILGFDQDVKKIISVVPTEIGNVGTPTPSSLATLELTDGSIVTANSGAWNYAQASWYLEPLPGATCTSEGPEQPPQNPDVPPVTYIDESTNCVYVVNFKGFIREAPDGPISPVYQIESDTSLRYDGGRMGGCNLGPVIYSPGPNGPGGPSGPTLPPIPVPPNPPGPDPDGVPWWAAPLLAGSTAAALNLIGQAIDELFETKLPAGSFSLQAPCDVDEEGNPLVQTWNFPEQTAQERMLAHQITGLEALQTHLNWKTPTCDCGQPIPEGNWRTISFRSDETSPYGKSRLRKRFRYLSVSGNDLGTLIDHWKDFVWEGGPYRVRWIGKSWRTPEVWAASESEGQRVIHHAAREAGFSPLEDGRWSTRVSSSTRLGVQSTLRVDTTGGYYWITERDGSNNRPTVGIVSPDNFVGGRQDTD